MMARTGGITLRGWPAVIVIAMVVVLYGLTFVVSRSSLDDEALSPIRLQLQGEYTSAVLPELDPNDPDPEVVERLTELDQIEFASVSARGSGEKVIVRVEPLVNGQPPPDGRDVRYYQMSWSSLTGWRMRRETTAFSYYTTLF
jgi:hypothetical protein